MTKIAVDIDQTLYDFDSAIREEFFELAMETGEKSYLKGAYSVNQEWRNLTDVLGTDIALEAIGRVHDRQLDQVPFKDAANTINALDKDGYEILYVTSRLEKYEESTKNWLALSYFPQHENVICSTHDKSEHIKFCKYLIDDRPRTIVNFLNDFTWKLSNGSKNSSAKRLAFGLWTRYNGALTDIEGVYLAPTWNGIRYYLERKGVLSEGSGLDKKLN